MEHGEELARWHDHMVAEPSAKVSAKRRMQLVHSIGLPGNDRVMHDGLVRLVFEVVVPA